MFQKNRRIEDHGLICGIFPLNNKTMVLLVHVGGLLVQEIQIGFIYPMKELMDIGFLMKHSTHRVKLRWKSSRILAESLCLRQGMILPKNLQNIS